MLARISYPFLYKLFWLTGVCGAGLGAGSPALAAYPERPIVIVVSYAPGGGTDKVARTLSRYLSKALNQTVLVENKPGAGGTIGASFVKRANPDGYTLLLVDPAFAINTGLMPNVGYDIKKDFTPVATVTKSPVVLSVAPGLPVTNLAQMLALSRQRPEGLTYSSPGVGSTPHVAGELLKYLTKSNFTHAPYKGANPAVTALAAGHVDFSFAAIAAAKPFAQQKIIRAIATTGLERSVEFPDLPAIAESLPGFEGYFWTALYAPANTPAAVVQKLDEAMRAVLADEEVVASITSSGDAVSYAPADKVGTFVDGEAHRWAKLIAEVGIKPE